VESLSVHIRATVPAGYWGWLRSARRAWAALLWVGPACCSDLICSALLCSDLICSGVRQVKRGEEAQARDAGWLLAVCGVSSGRVQQGEV
jgi:hypothetical protein